MGAGADRDVSLSHGGEKHVLVSGDNSDGGEGVAGIHRDEARRQVRRGRDGYVEEKRREESLKYSVERNIYTET